MIYEDKFREQAKAIIRQAIAERPMDMHELIERVAFNQIPYPQRAAKEAAWAMAEECTAFFNNQWLLELTPEKDIICKSQEQLETEAAPVELKLSRVYEVSIVESDKKTIDYRLWTLFGNPYDGELHVPMQDTDTGQPKFPWVIKIVESKDDSQ